MSLRIDFVNFWTEVNILVPDVLEKEGIEGETIIDEQNWHCQYDWLEIHSGSLNYTLGKHRFY